MGPHIVSAFDDELIGIQAKISEMGGLAEEILSMAIDSLKHRDADLAQKAIARDKRLDELEYELDELATTTIALRQPMAQDLRVIITALKMSSTIERIGDLGKNVAKRAIAMSQERPAKISNSIIAMGNSTLAQLSSVLNAFASKDTDLAVEIWKKDVELDEAYNAIFREVVTYMMEDPRSISFGSQMLFIAKNLERIGDHTTHISEGIYYVATGEPLGDERPKGEPAGLEFDRGE